MVAHRRTSTDRDPQLPADLDVRALPRAVRAELRGLSPEAAEFVGGHLVMAGQLVDSDPELAFAHAEAARRRAARLPIVREASAETAYAAGEYVHALAEYRALRRMTGNDEYLPVMADCERALGRHQDALDLVREAKHAGLGPDLEAEALMVEAGVREDMGQAAEGLRLLKTATRLPGRGLGRGTRARLHYAYADLLLRTGDEEAAVRWFTTAADLDTEGVTDADERLARLQGMVLELDDEGIEGWAPEEEPEDIGDDAAASDGDDGRADVRSLGDEADDLGEAEEDGSVDEVDDLAGARTDGSVDEVEDLGGAEADDPGETEGDDSIDEVDGVDDLGDDEGDDSVDEGLVLGDDEVDDLGGDELDDDSVDEERVAGGGEEDGDPVGELDVLGDALDDDPVDEGHRVGDDGVDDLGEDEGDALVEDPEPSTLLDPEEPVTLLDETGPEGSDESDPEGSEETEPVLGGSPDDVAPGSQVDPGTQR